MLLQRRRVCDVRKRLTIYIHAWCLIVQRPLGARAKPHSFPLDPLHRTYFSHLVHYI